MGRRHAETGRALSAFSWLLVSGLLCACNQSIEIGEKLRVAEPVGDSSVPDPAAAAGAEAAPAGAGGMPSPPVEQPDAAGAGGEPAPAASSGIIWSSSAESGDVLDWTEDGPAYGGELLQSVTRTVSMEQAHSGSSSVKLSFSTGDGQHHWAELYRKVETAPAYYSAWFFITEAHVPSVYWSVFYFFSEATPGDSTTRRALWDLNLNNESVYFYDEITKKFVDAAPRKPYAIGRWFQLEAYLDHPPGGGGRLVVWQDGEQILDIAELGVAPSDTLYWAIGSQTDQLSPAACTMYLDDAVISTTRSEP